MPIGVSKVCRLGALKSQILGLFSESMVCVCILLSIYIENAWSQNLEASSVKVYNVSKGAELSAQSVSNWGPEFADSRAAQHVEVIFSHFPKHMSPRRPIAESRDV